MSKQKVYNYVMNTPHNTNPNILGSLLDEPTSWNDLTDKPFYEEVAEIEIASAGVYSELDSSLGACAARVPYHFALDEIPQKLSVTIDDVTYNDLQVSVLDGFGFVAGNLALANALVGTSFPNTGEPFIIALNSMRSAYMVIATDTSGKHHRVRITALGKKYQPINYRYLPDAYKTSHFNLRSVDDTQHYAELLRMGVPVVEENGGRLLHVDYFVEGANSVADYVKIDSNGELFLGREDDHEGSGATLIRQGKIAMSAAGKGIGLVAAISVDENGVPYTTKPYTRDILWEPNVLTSPSGKKFKLQISDDGTVSATEV